MKTEDELKDITELLKKTGNENPYRVPEGYFGSMHRSMLRRLGIREHVDAIPEGYFDALPDLVLQRAKRGAKIIPINPFSRMAKYIGVAASFVILLMAGSIFLQPESTETTIELDYLDYLSENLNDVEPSSLWDLNILDESGNLEELNVYDDDLLDYYLERNLDDIELAYLEEIIDY